MLELVKEGIYSSITVASIEMGSLYKEVQKVLKTNEIPQFFFSSGYISAPKKLTTRHPLEDKIVTI
ncbi:MAG TPA: hypothetical protein PLM75_04305, partial [bacterium]|nr:hypothetical protein [bacterium]